MIELFHAIECPFSARARICLNEKALPFRSVEVDLDGPSSELEALNPKGQVPVIRDGTFVLYESAIIGEYLEDEYPVPRLLPSSPKKRAKARLLVDFCETELAPIVYMVAFSQSESRRDRSLDILAKLMPRLETALNGQDYLVGEFSLADIMIAPWVARLAKESTPTAVENWIHRLLARPSVAHDPFIKTALGMPAPGHKVAS